MSKPAAGQRETITVGGTTYALRKQAAAGGVQRDYYEPDPALPPPEGKPATVHHWLVYADTRTNKLFFRNAHTKEVKWTLPDAAAAAAHVDPSVPSPQASPAKADRPDRAGDKAGDASSEVGDLLAAGPGASPGASARATPTTYDEQRKKIEDSIHAKIRARLGSRTPSPATAALSSPSKPKPDEPAPAAAEPAPAPAPAPAKVASPPRAVPAEKAKEEAPAAATAAAPAAATTTAAESGAEGGAEGGSERSGSRSSAASWRDRLAQHRNRRSSPATPSRRTPVEASISAAPTPERHALDSPSPAPEEPAPAMPAARTSAIPTGRPPPAPSPLASPVEASPVTAAPAPAPAEAAPALAAAPTLAPAPTAGAAAHQQQLARSIEEQLLEERKRRFIDADAQLQRERAEALRQERLALERQRLAAAEAARQEEELARIAGERARMERERLELERRAVAELRARAGAAPREALPAMEGAEDVAHAERARQSADRNIQAAREFTAASAAALIDELHQPLETDPDPAALAPYSAESPAAVERHLKQLDVRYGPKHKYTGTVHGKMKHGRGTYTYDPRGEFTHEGQWEKDKKHGRGVASLPHCLYDGEWRDDRPHGAGVLHTKHIKASATFAKGVVHGNAVVHTKGGDVFAGKARSNAPSTPGALTRATGDHVEWQWADPDSPGTGTVLITFANGDTYAGAVEKHQFHGQGRFVFAASGDEYAGGFRHNELTGKGTYRFASDGSVYEGDVVAGMFHGRGAFTTAEHVYDGAWKDGRMHGQGTVTYANGDVWSGTFEHDQRVRGRYVFSKLFALGAPAKPKDEKEHSAPRRAQEPPSPGRRKSGTPAGRPTVTWR